MAFNLESIADNQTAIPRTIIYGDPGIGKTTFACSGPSPIVIRTEDGLGSLKVKCFPLSKSFEDVMEALNSLLEDKHNYKTLVIDSLDWLEPLIWDHVCATWAEKNDRKRLANIEDAGFGKGYVEAVNYWRMFLDMVTRLRDERGMLPVMIAHSAKIKNIDPMLPTYESHDLKLHKRAAAICEEYSDVILFGSKPIKVYKEGKGPAERTMTKSGGENIVYTQSEPSFLAKSRYDLPPQLPLDFKAYLSALESAGVAL